MTPDILNALLVLLTLLKNTVLHPLSVERGNERASFAVLIHDKCAVLGIPYTKRVPYEEADCSSLRY